MAPQSPQFPQPPPSAQAKPAEADASAGFVALLNIEKDAREARNIGELQHLMAHETRKLTRARQVIVFRHVLKHQQAVAVSGQAVVERSSPLVQGFENTVSRLAKESGLSQPRAFELRAYAGDGDQFGGYPFQSLLWTPLKTRSGFVLGGLLLAREQTFERADTLVATRLAETYSHALSLLIAEPRLAQRLAAKAHAARYALCAAAAAICAGLLIPVPMTTLAPFEITAESPIVIAAPMEGVIEEVLADPSAKVEAGQPLIRYADTALRNRLEVAEREVSVAAARLKQATQVAFNDVQGRHDMSVAAAEHELKAAERDFARDMFERATIRAPRAGILIYTDKKSLAGKPVATGERLMQIADPARVEATIDVATGDAIALNTGADVKLYLDSDPLEARAAKVVEAEYQARPRAGNVLAYRVAAKLEGGGAPPRIGARGTAQIYGARVRLAYYLFRRPLAALRQWAGL